jgi:hypothetical protein
MGKYEKIGIWAFYIGLIIALLVAIISPTSGYSRTFLAILAVLGIIVGILNVTYKEASTFLIAAIALLLSASSLIAIATLIPYLGDIIATFLQGIVIFIAPGAAIVSIRAFYDIAKRR